MSPPIAVIGGAARFAGATSLGQLLANLAAGRSAIAAAPPPGRWPGGVEFPGGFLDNVYVFDAARFGMPDHEAAAMDPQQRWMLTVTADALEGLDLATREVGVFVAATQLAYQDAVTAALEPGLAPVSKNTLAGNLLSMLAARISHRFDLKGPSFSLATACASSLVALHQACLALHAGDCEVAIVGGVNLNLTPTVHRLFERAGALSPTGQLRAFDGGDGTVPGDGVGCVILERLGRAEELGHRVWAQVLATAVNNCGRTIGVMAPRPEGQVDVMRRALARSPVSGEAIQLIEAHGTGTDLGDKIERQSIDTVYPHGPRVSAVKRIVGHTLGAAGIAGLLSAIGQLDEGQLGAVDAFGFGGSNAHVILRGGRVPPEVLEEGPRVARGRTLRLGTEPIEGWLHIVSEAEGGGSRFTPWRAGPDALVKDGVYVITGASGGIGRELARALARNQRAQLLLVGRRPRDADLFAAFAAALLDDEAGDELLVATAVTGRDAHPELAEAVGPFAHGVPVRVTRDVAANIRALRAALAHADTALSSVRAGVTPEASVALGRFFLSWLEPPPSLALSGALRPLWDRADLRFATESTATEVSAAALLHEGGLVVHLRGGPRATRVAESMPRHLEAHLTPRSALVLYAPADTAVPFAVPTLVETVTSASGVTELILLPGDERQLRDAARRQAQLRDALALTRADVVALAGMLPSLTGLGRDPLGPETVMVTTGHAATVVAMLRTIERALLETGRAFAACRVGVHGFGAIGQASLALCVARLGRPRAVQIADPRFGTSAADLAGCDLILGATSGGRALDVARLEPGTIVVDDSFPRAFDDEAAWTRMLGAVGVLLVGGGSLDVGPLVRRSSFPQAEAVRAGLPTRWLPGCHAEALLIAAHPELGPTVGPVDLARALAVLEAVDRAGWRAPPLHLGAREIPASVLGRLASHTSSASDSDSDSDSDSPPPPPSPPSIDQRGDRT